MSVSSGDAPAGAKLPILQVEHLTMQFGGLVAVAFILIAAAGMRSSEERAQDAVNRDRDNRPNATAVEFGTNAEQVAP